LVRNRATGRRWSTGGYLGVQLARAGVDVSLVARGAHLAAMLIGE
jgi:ketopantoate reductase